MPVARCAAFSEAEEYVGSVRTEARTGRQESAAPTDAILCSSTRALSRRRSARRSRS